MLYYDKIFLYLSRKGFFKRMSDEEYLRRRYHACLKKELNLETPTAFNEKIQWLKLHDRNPLYTTMVDKYAAKAYVSSVIGEQYIIPTLGVWDHFDDIDFDALPRQFALKCTHDSGSLVIVQDKEKMDIKRARRIINKSLKRNYYFLGREWPYKDVKPRIIAEKYMKDKETDELRDYKFFCFNGVPKALFIASDRQDKATETKFDFFDMNFRHLDFTNGHPNSNKQIKKPIRFEEMKKMAAMLSKGIPHVRVDFYEVDERIYFGEITFFHWSGFVPFNPPEWDKIFGDWIVLPKQSNCFR